MSNTARMVGVGRGTALPSASSPKTGAREQDKHLFIQKDFAARGNRTGAVGLSLGEKLPQEKKMRTLAMILGAAAAFAVAAPASADPAAGRVQLAQAQDAQSGSGMGASQQSSSGKRDSGAAAIAWRSTAAAIQRSACAPPRATTPSSSSARRPAVTFTASPRP